MLTHESKQHCGVQAVKLHHIAVIKPVLYFNIENLTQQSTHDLSHMDPLLVKLESCTSVK